MKTTHLSINENGHLEVLEYETGILRLSLDIMNDFDGALAKWTEIRGEFAGKGYAISSSIDFPSEFGVDGAILEQFIASMFVAKEVA